MIECYKVIDKAIHDPGAICYISPKQRPSWNRYIEFVDDFANVYGFEDKNTVVLNVPKSAIMPLLAYKRDSEVYINTCRKSAATLHSKKGVTAKAVRSFMGVVPVLPPQKPPEVSPILPRIVPKNSKTNDAAARNAGLVNSLETPILNGLRAVMDKEGKDSEYAAVAFLLKFWKKNNGVKV
jgi:hypothetical protein